jgi:hypothetical protein
MRLRYRTSVCALALIAGSAAMQLEPAVVRDLVFDHNGQHIAVGAVRVPLWSAAWAQSPDVFSLENVSFTFGSVSYEAKRIEFSGVTSSRAEIEALFSSASSEPMAIRLARINANHNLQEHRPQRHRAGQDRLDRNRSDGDGSNKCRGEHSVQLWPDSPERSGSSSSRNTL